MRILCELSPHRHNMVIGWKAACEAAGYEFVLWDEKQKPAFDVFDEINPDVFIKTSPLFSRGTHRALLSRGKSTKTIDGTEWLPGFDYLNLRPGQYRPNLLSEILCIGNYRTDNAHLLEEFVFPLSAKYKLKVLGNKRWPIPEYLGSAPLNMIPDLIASTKICINVSSGGIAPERLFQYLGVGAIVVSNNDHGMRAKNPHHSGESLPCLEVEKEAKGFIETVDYLVNEAKTHTSGSHWMAQAIRGQNEVRRHHTYSHRMADMFQEAGFQREAMQIRGAGGWA